MTAETEKQGLRCQEDGRSVLSLSLVLLASLLNFSGCHLPPQYKIQQCVPLTVDLAIIGKHSFCNQLSPRGASVFHEG